MHMDSRAPMNLDAIRLKYFSGQQKISLYSAGGSLICGGPRVFRMSRMSL